MDNAAPMLQMVLSLAAVVAMILGLAWMTRRMQTLRGRVGGELKVKATLAVGTKERVVIIEAAGQQFLIGVAPGQVNILKALGPVEGGAAAGADAPQSAASADAATGLPSFRAALALQLQQAFKR